MTRPVRARRASRTLPPRPPWPAGALVLLAAACGGSEPAPDEVRTSILSRFAERRFMLDAVDVGSEADEGLLLASWYRPQTDGDGSTWVWAADAPSLELWTEAPRDAALRLRLGAARIFDEPQEVELVLNGRELGSREVPHRATWCSWPVAAVDLRTGRNLVELRPRFASSPRDAGKSDDQRVLSIRCDWALLTEPSEEPEAVVATLRERGERPSARPREIELRPDEGAAGWLRPDGSGELALSFVGDAGAVVSILVAEEETGNEWDLRTIECTGERQEERFDLGDLPAERMVWSVLHGSRGSTVRLVGADLLAEREPWNVVLMVVDTLRADAILDPEGGIATPAIDRLAADGLVFPSAFAHAPMTLPSHTALFSSRLPHESGVVNNWQEIDSELPLLSDWIAEFGYRTEAVLSLGTLWNPNPGTSLDRGFAVYEHGANDMATADVSARRMEDALRRLQKRQPFFLFAHFSDPHAPYNAHGLAASEADLVWNGEVLGRVPTSQMTVWRREVVVPPGESLFEVVSEDRLTLKFLRFRGLPESAEEVFVEGGLRERGDRVALRVTNPTDEPIESEVALWVHDAFERSELAARYRREVEFVDRWVGEVLDDLRERGLYDSTLIVFTADHGEALGDHGHVGHVETLYDELIHVPLIVKLPSEHPASDALSARTGGLVRHVDLAPTILDLLGLPGLPGERGKSLLLGGSSVHVAETRKPEASRDIVCLRDERWKMIYVADEDRFEMYDLAADPRELEDVYAEHADERSDWPELLVTFAARAAEGASASSIDPATLERLKGMGYFVDQEVDFDDAPGDG